MYVDAIVDHHLPYHNYSVDRVIADGSLFNKL